MISTKSLPQQKLSDYDWENVKINDDQCLEQKS